MPCQSDATPRVSGPHAESSVKLPPHPYLDVTLVDTSADIAQAANRALEDIGKQRRSVSATTRPIEACAGHASERLCGDLQREASPAAQTALSDDLLACLETHYLRVACVSGRGLRGARRVLQATHPWEIIDLLVGDHYLPQRTSPRKR